MGHNDHIDYELNEAIEELNDTGGLNAIAYGVAQQVISQGFNSLSDKQKAVWERYLVPFLKKRAEEIEANRVLNSNPS